MSSSETNNGAAVTSGNVSPAPSTGASEKGSEHEKRGPSKQILFLKRSCKILGSHLGLFLVTVIYAVIGGYVFKALESQNEITNCETLYQKYIDVENSTKYSIWAMSKTYGEQGFDDPDVKAQLEDEFQRQLVEFRNASITLQYDGKNCSMLGQKDGPEMSWSIGGSLLFAVTIMTTIGYGNIAPETMYGRIIVMAYALIGIPITLMMLADIGDLLTDMSKFVYVKVCCCGCFRPKRHEHDEDSRAATPALEAGGPPDPARFHGGRSPVPSECTVVDDESDEEDEDMDYREASIPLTLSLVMLVLYLMFGACVFHLTEAWDVLAAAYYCFITISTVGFGDYVPGTSGMRTIGEKFKMVFAGLYLMFGLAMLSMCFQLIHEEIVVKFRMLAERAARLKRAVEERRKKEADGSSRPSSAISRRSATVAPAMDTPKTTKKD